MATLTAALRRTARLYGQRVAVHDGARSITWSEFAGRVARAATVLDELGIVRGHRFGILALNSRSQAELIQSGYWSGAIPVPINFRLAPPEIRTVLEDAGCNWLAVDATCRALLDTSELAPWRDRCLNLGADAQQPAGPAAYDHAVRDAKPAAPVDADPEDEALLLYTGGTSGRPKGVPLSHRNILANALQVAFAWPPRGDDVALHVAPMFHSAELVMTCLTLAGAAHAYLPKFSPEALFQAIQEHRVTAVLLVPAMLMMAVQSQRARDYDLSSLRRIIYGASPMSAESIRQTADCFPGAEIVQGYGLTETAPLVAMLDAQTHRDALAGREPERLRACGRPLPGVDLRLVDEDGREVSPGEAGEIAVRGPNVFSGYLNRPGETREALRDGWFHTGDVGKMDGDGYLYILDRKKDLIITGGENVYSGEVEAALHQHPAVAEAAVIGVPDERYGETVFAVVVRVQGASVTESELREHCTGRIGSFKIPKHVAFVDQLPRSALGKVLKTELRATFSAREG